MQPITNLSENTESEYNNLKLEIKNNIGILTINCQNNKVNTLSNAVFFEFDKVLKKISEDHNIKALLIISGKSDNFIAGADISEIKNIDSALLGQEMSRKGQNVLNRLSRMRITTIAAVNGACMGGGLELILACDYRMISDSPKTILALPEIKLGLIPGLGGTQRLPRLIGLQQAIEMIVSTKNIRAKKALEIGLVDEVVPQDILFDIAIERSLEFSKKGKRIVTDKNSGVKNWLLEETKIGNNLILKKARDKVIETTKGKYPAPLKALEVIIEGYSKDLDKALEIEAQGFGEMCESTVSKNLIGIFEATNELKKPYENITNTPKVNKIGIVGAGLMGAGIAKIALDQDILVRIKDISYDHIGKLLKNINEYYQKSVDKKIIKPYDLQMKMDKVSGTTDYTGFKRADFVIEAVFEDITLKQKILSELENVISPECVIATNTSGIPISEIAKGLKNPERLIGMHFFSPVEKMPLIEIVITPHTSKQVISRTVELGKKMGKTVIVVNDGLGFYTTRILASYMNESLHILSEGGNVQQIDKVMTDFGFPVGPFRLLDEVGIDVGIKVIKLLNKSFSRMVLVQGLEKLELSGRLGKKNNKGFYNYQDNSKEIDISVYDDIGITHKRAFSDDEIKIRLVMSFLNEALYCLDDNIILSERDGDIGAVFGLGFPTFLGGPFKYMKDLGYKYINEKLEYLHKKYGDRFKISNQIKQLKAD